MAGQSRHFVHDDQQHIFRCVECQLTASEHIAIRDSLIVGKPPAPSQIPKKWSVYCDVLARFEQGNINQCMAFKRLVLTSFPP